MIGSITKKLLTVEMMSI